MKRIFTFIIAILFVFSAGSLYAQKDTINPGHHAPVEHPSPADAAPAEATPNLAKAAANPIANMISLPFQFNFNFGIGDYDRMQMVMNFQPVLPFKLNKTWNVITRTIIPVMKQPLNAETGNTWGVGNISFNTFFVPKVLGNGFFTYGFGPSLNIPTASAPELGGDAFGIGPTIVFLFMPGDFVVGATGAAWWSYKAPHGANGLNAMFAQMFATWNIKNGWFINSTPTFTANFNAPDGEQWVIPAGGGFGKVQHFGKHYPPIKFMLQYYTNLVAPPGAAKGSLVFQMVYLFPHKPKSTGK